MKRIEAAGVPSILVSTAENFALDPIVRAVACAKLQERGVNVLAADQRSFVPPTSARLVSHVLKVAKGFDEAISSAHTQSIADRMRSTGPRHRKRYADMLPDAVNLVKRMHNGSVKAGVRLTLREISAKLADAGRLK